MHSRDPGRNLRVGPLPLGNPAAVSAKHSLMITDLKVVEDPGRTFNPCTNAGTPMGKWTFGYLMEQMANPALTGVSPAHFARRWLRRWEHDQVVNDWPVAKRPQVVDRVIKHREAKSGGPWAPPDLSKAPFKLLAIVNRIDLHENPVYGGGSGGEGRFVFCAVDENCNPLQFTVIFEYGVKVRGCAGLRAWARQWADLGNLGLGSPQYNAALEAVTEQFARAGADPARPNGSALNQLRTNEIALASPWELREFRIFDTDSDSHHLRQVTVKQTPDLSANETSRLSDYVNADAAAVKLQKHQVPIEFPPANGPFLGGAALVPGAPPPPFFWSGAKAPPIADGEARHQFSIGTCNGCHARETGTVFTHVKPAPFGTEAPLSGFLTGTDGTGNPFEVTDPADMVTKRGFNDLLRRAGVLDDLANAPCFTHLFRRPLRMTH